MSIFQCFLLSTGLATDAFAVSVCKGVSAKEVKIKHMLCVALYFGLFQAMMPLAGYFIGAKFEHLITSFDHYIAFGLLTMIGVKMIKDSVSPTKEENGKFTFTEMLPLAVATSIDALAVGITFSSLKVNVKKIILLIGIITFFSSFLGIKIGSIFGNKYAKKASFAGGAVLIFLGFKILFDHI